MLLHPTAIAFLLLVPGSLAAQEWPQWRGPNRDGVSSETGLLKEWPGGAPKLLWQIDRVGVGYSSLSVRGGRLYTQGDLQGVEHVICLNAQDGTIVWAAQPEPVATRLAQRVASELKTMDRDGDGIILEAEALARLGWSLNQFDRPVDGDPKAIAAARAKRLLAKLDKDGDGRLDFLEFGPGLRDKAAEIDVPDKQADAAALAKKRVDAIFDALDKDKDGRITRAEASGSLLASLSDKIDQPDPSTQKKDQVLTREEVQAYFEKAEAGRDGILTEEELAAYFAAKFPGRDGIMTADELRSVYGGYRNGYGDGPRGTPTLDGDFLYAEGGAGDVCCLEAATGKTVWHVNLVSDLGGGVPGWGYSESPLILGDWVVVTPGGKKGTLAALDKKTGKVVWRSEGDTEGAHYSSPVIAELGGVRQIVQMASKSVFGVRADNGGHLWAYSHANNGTANICTPVPWKDHVFASSAYGTGGGLVRIATDGAGAEEVYFEKKMANHHGGIVRVDDHLYGFGESGLICMNFLTGKIAWAARSVSKGSLVYADGMLYCLGEGHQMALVEATPKEYREHGRFKIDNLGRPSWAHPVVAGGRLYLRNQERLAAYDVKAP
ncbi:MAG TPA: PQQ-binding-like beta-propeller repeat protein [Planctomycetota bacterium]|nr:PQQ-binding-like beta-propeller repeat protein [Planctomycetota bacterium]